MKKIGIITLPGLALGVAGTSTVYAHHQNSLPIAVMGTNDQTISKETPIHCTDYCPITLRHAHKLAQDPASVQEEPLLTDPLTDWKAPSRRKPLTLKSQENLLLPVDPNKAAARLEHAVLSTAPLRGSAKLILK